MNNNKKKILVLGAEGFIGKNICLFLKEKYNVFAPSLKELDLAKSKSVENYLKSKDIDCIINAATVPQINKSYPNSVFEENVKMFFNILEFKNSETKLINLGSGSEYSREFWKKKMKETFFGKHMPSDSHSYSKYVQAKYIENSKQRNLYHLRIFGIFGKYEDYIYKFISNTIAKNLFSIPVIIHQNCLYDYLYINDFCEIINLYIENSPTEKVYNVTPDNPIELKRIAEIISIKLNKDLDIKILNSGYGKEYTGDNSRLKLAFPNLNFTDYEISIDQLIKYYKDNINLIDVSKLKNDKFLDYAKKINPIK